MKDLINKWYKGHALLYKILLFVGTTFLIVYLFPKSGRFKYNFDQGKPWQSVNLLAPFDFAIKKSTEELQEERSKAIKSSPIYFNLSKSAKNAVYQKYEGRFREIFPDSVTESNPKLYEIGKSTLDAIYDTGLLDENYTYDPEKSVVLLDGQTQVLRTQFSELTSVDEFKNLLENRLLSDQYAVFEPIFISFFFDIVEPNLFLNESLTQTARDEKLDNISKVRGSIEKGTLIISKGEIVEGDKFDILKSLQAEYKSQIWNASDYNMVIFAYALLVALALLMLLLFLRKYRIEVFLNNTKVTFIFFNILLMIMLTTFLVNYNSEYVYVVPLCILPLVLKAFFDARLGLFAHVLTVLLLGFVVPNNSEYIFLQIIAGIVTILTVSELYKRANLFISVGQITLIYILSYFAFYVIHEGSITNIELRTFGFFVLCGLATLFVQPLIYIYEKVFGLVSDVSLLELSDTNTKLLKELSNKAPGTFHHSLNVANLAEASANEIGANAMLIRVGALYHDIGKMKNPTFFTENQATGLNPHDELSSRESSKIIIDHVLDGIEIAKKNNLPDRVIDFIRTHHGTSMVYYFFMKEKSLDEDISEDDFRYPGPKPFSKETAILMMCDSVEAASKSLKEPSSSKIDKFVDSIIAKQMEDGQFLNANITFKEIQMIKKVLKAKLANIFHLRIEYPE